MICPHGHDEGMIPRDATPQEVFDDGCELGIAYDPCIRVPAEAGDAPAGRPPVRLVERNSPNSVPSRTVRAWRASRTPAALGSVALAAGVWWVAAMFLAAAALFAVFEMPWRDD